MIGDIQFGFTLDQLPPGARLFDITGFSHLGKTHWYAWADGSYYEYRMEEGKMVWRCWSPHHSGLAWLLTHHAAQEVTREVAMQRLYGVNPDMQVSPGL